MVSEKQPLQLLDNLLFPKIFRTFRIAIQPAKLVIAFLTLVIICLAGWLMDFSKTVVATKGSQGNETELQIYMADPGGVQPYIESFKEKGERTGVFTTLWCFAAARFKGAVDSLFAFNLPAVVENIIDCFKTIGWALKYHFLYCIIFFVIKLAAISVGGGAICRIAALQFARGEKPGLTEALRFSIKKFTSFFATPLVPVGMVILIGVFIFLLGLIGNIPRAGELIMAVFIFLALIAGALIAIVLIGSVAGFNLMFPAVAYDGSDCFDAISRSFSYVYARPWRMGFYTAIAAIYGAICYTFVRLFAFLLLWVTHRFLQLGVWVDNSSKEVNKLMAIWQEPRFIKLADSSGLAAGNWSESLAAFLVQLLLLAVVGLVVSFIISFYFSANTIIYSLMRNKVDSTALDDVYTHFDEAKTMSTPAESGSEEVQPEAESETQTDSSSSW
jgi:hypothetical protein